MSTISVTSLAHSFSYALLYSLWQGALIYGLLFALLKALPGVNARVKYNMSLGALALMCIWFADTWDSQYAKLNGVTVYISQAASNGSALGIVRPFTANAGAPAHFDIFQNYLPMVSRYVPFIIALYCVGLAIMFFRFALNLARLTPLRTSATAPIPEHWQQFVNRWQIILGISRNVKVLFSKRVHVPIMLGTIRPVILLPISVCTQLTTEQVEAILVHELAHIRRHDYLVNIIQTLVETILFFNPFVWLTSSIIRREREHCCDDLVVSCAADPLHYAQALALIENDRINSLSLAATGNKNQLFNRIKRIMEMKKENIAHRRYSLLLVAVVATCFTASMVAFTPTFAQKSKTEKTVEKETEKKGSPQKVTTTKTVTKDESGKKKVVTKTVTAVAGSEEQEDVSIGDVRVKVLADDDGHGHGHATAKVIVVNDDKEGRGGKTKKLVIANGRNRTERTIVIDEDKIERQIARAMEDIENIDWDAIGDGIEDALANLNVKINLDNLDKEVRIEINEELEKSREALEDARREIDRNRREAEKSRHMARVHAHNAHAHSSNNNEIRTDSDDMEAMLAKMDKDGLIDRADKFKIEKREGEMYINGQKQTSATLEKYGRYLKGKNVVVSGSKNNLNINVSN